MAFPNSRKLSETLSSNLNHNEQIKEGAPTLSRSVMGKGG
jgi:hypothetical protein